MDPGYSPENRKVIEDNAKSLHIPITIFETDIFDSVYHVENSPCYLCARFPGRIRRQPGIRTGGGKSRRRSRTGKRSSFMYRKIEETPEREKMLIRLKELRLKRGYSMLQAARKIFSHLDTYNRYEKGIREIPLDSLMLLAKTYDCSLDYLAGISDQPRKYGK